VCLHHYTSCIKKRSCTRILFL